MYTLIIKCKVKAPPLGGSIPGKEGPKDEAVVKFGFAFGQCPTTLVNFTRCEAQGEQYQSLRRRGGDLYPF
jgi:hypothetical protein